MAIMNDPGASMILVRQRIKGEHAVNKCPWEVAFWSLRFLSGELPNPIEPVSLTQVGQDFLAEYRIPLRHWVRDAFLLGTSKSDVLIDCWKEGLDRSLIQWVDGYFTQLAQARVNLVDSSPPQAEVEPDEIEFDGGGF